MILLCNDGSMCSLLQELTNHDQPLYEHPVSANIWVIQIFYTNPTIVCICTFDSAIKHQAERQVVRHNPTYYSVTLQWLQRL